MLLQSVWQPMKRSLAPTSYPLLRALGQSNVSFKSADSAISKGYSSEAATGAQPAKFDAEMSELYSRFAAQHNHPRGPWPMMLKTVQAVVPPEGGAGLKVLDLASGPGQPAITIAQAIPNAQVIATDVSEDMIGQARDAAAGIPNVAVQLADAQDLSQFESNSFDVITCCYGYMFPEDKALALKETLRVLRPGGTLVATTWNRVDILKICRDVMTEVLGAPPSPPPLNPMSLSEPGLFEGLLQTAGFVSIETSDSTYPFEFGNEKEMQFKMGTMLLKDKLNELDGWAVAETAFWDNIGKYTVEDESGNMIMPENTFKLTVAKKA